jgi:hypothetical protein
MMKFFYSALSILAIISCNKASDQRQEVLALRQMGNLATTEYVVTKIVKATDDQTWYKLGDRKILISCQANIKAGIDLTKLTENDVVIDGKNITLYLPPPQILSLSIPPEKINVEYKEISIMRDDFDNAERDALLTQAENQIRNSVKELGVMETTEKNTTLFVSNFLKKLGFESVNISYSKRPEINIHHD